MFSTSKTTLKTFSPESNSENKLENSLTLTFRWWQVPTLLSLDAPLVACVWQFLLARAFSISLPWQLTVLLFGAVWLVYVADRCLDAQTLNVQHAVTTRHQFYVLYSRSMWTLWALVLLLCSVLSWQLEPAMLMTGLSVAGLTALYLFIVHNRWRRIAKELWVASLFSIGTHLALWLVQPVSFVHVISTVLFVMLCFLNCSLIAFWERAADARQGHNSIALAKPKVRPWLEILGISLIIGSLICLMIFPQQWTLWSCLALSSGLLGLLEQVHHQLPVSLLRVLADAVLLTPMLMFFFC